MRLLELVKLLLVPEKPELTRAPEPQRGMSPFPAGMGPSRLVVFRHSEKSGDRRDPHLSLPGRRRAEQLVEYIPATFGRPQFLIAARTSARSRRPVETLEPLAAAMALDVAAKFAHGQSTDLVKMLSNKRRCCGGLGVICWRHSELPGLVCALGAPPATFSDSWKMSDYSTIVDVTYPGDGEAHARRLQMPF
jgi:hypothetical protein